MGFLANILGPVATFASSIFSAKSAEKTNERNIDQAQNQMDFQERMSNTAHQREVQDLIAAGLNPLLSANSGASSPAGAMATIENPYREMPKDIVNSARMAMDMKMNAASIKNIEAQTALNSASAARTAADIPRTSSLSKIGERIVRGLDAVDSIVGNSAKWWGEKTANINIPKFAKN